MDKAVKLVKLLMDQKLIKEDLSTKELLDLLDTISKVI